MTSNAQQATQVGSVPLARSLTGNTARATLGVEHSIHNLDSYVCPLSIDRQGPLKW